MASVVSNVEPLSERRFFTAMALTMMAVTLVGFGPTYYFANLNHAPRPILTPALHVHGALATAWLLLLIVQTRLIAARRRDVHRRLGIAGALLALAVLVSGILLAIGSERRQHTEVNAGTLVDPYVFLIFPVAAVGLFALFVALGVINRNRPGTHKRLMLLGTISLIGPALARIVTQLVQGAVIPGVPGVVGAVLLLNVFLAALVLHDFRTNGRLHSATLWGGGVLLLSEPLRFIIGFSAPWQAFARMLVN